MPKNLAGVVIYSTPEAARLLGVSTKTLRGYIKAGRIQAQKYGRSWHIAEQNIQSFLGGTPRVQLTAIQADVVTRPKRKAKPKAKGKGKRSR